MASHCSNPQSLSSPSFTTHSSHRLEDIAARVIKELSNESNPYAEKDFNPICEEFEAEIGEIDAKKSCFQEELQSDDGLIEFEGNEDVDDEEEQEFEFPLIEVIMGQSYREEEKRPLPEKVIRLPLKMLFQEEREKPSEIDELNGIPIGTYCVWKPKKVEEEEEERRWNKSGLNGLSKRWKWPALIHRSSSDLGKGRFVFLPPVGGEDKRKEKKVEKVEKWKTGAVSAEHLTEHGGDKRRFIWPGSFRK